MIAFDFVDLNCLQVTIDGRQFDHKLFHAVLTYSNWEVRIHQDNVELWYRGDRVEVMPRLYGKDKELIDFRHVIDSLIRKPGAFENYQYQDHLYPTTRFRMAYDMLQKQTKIGICD